MGKYLDKPGITHLWRRMLGKVSDAVDEAIESIPDFESDGAIDTMFDTEFDEETGQLKFGAGCASVDESTGVMTIEGAVVPVKENSVEVGKMIVIS